MAGIANGLTDPSNNTFSERFRPLESDTVTVFQCEKCRTILGDSTLFMCHSDDLGSITLRLREGHLPECRIQERWEKSDVPEISGSKFQRVRCKKCSTQVGMVFQKLPPNFSHMNGHLSLHVDSITSYEIPFKRCCNSQELTNTVQKMQEEILKMQEVILNLNQRLLTFEQCITDEDGNS